MFTFIVALICFNIGVGFGAAFTTWRTAKKQNLYDRYYYYSTY